MIRGKEMKEERYGNLVVVHESDHQCRRGKVLCLCDCGTKKEVILQNLKTGNTRSCGCQGKWYAKLSVFERELLDYIQKNNFSSGNEMLRNIFKILCKLERDGIIEDGKVIRNLKKKTRNFG